MITHEPLVEHVAAQARLSGTDEAARVVKVTLAALAHQLEVPRRQRLRQALPGPERDAAMVTVPPAGGGATELAREIGHNLETPPEHARYLVRTVLSEIAEADPELGQVLREGLPPDCASLFQAPEPYPERMHAATVAPAPLTTAELATELRRRPQWSGTSHHLTRTVALPADRLPPLLNQINKDSRALNHRCDHEQTDDGITFFLHTRSVDAVTALDLELADRIDAAVTAVGSGGRPG
jgi:pterin-4a-carbinolamine dehydratase/uncharacterized protein (DUF2267 family)